VEVPFKQRCARSDSIPEEQFTSDNISLLLQEQSGIWFLIEGE
jgi:hypothetical protein